MVQWKILQQHCIREELQQNARELTDGNRYEEYIPHELFHQWFGDFVTAESWSNLTVNESIANYSETIWDEHRHGKDAAVAETIRICKIILQVEVKTKTLVRYHYRRQGRHV